MVLDSTDESRPILVIATAFNLGYGWLLNVLMGQADSLLPWKYDHYLYAIDGALGVSPQAIALENFGQTVQRE